MSLKAVVNNEEFQGLDPMIQAEYVERDGRYILDVQTVTDGRSVYALEDVGGLKSALGTQKTRVQQLTQQLDEYKDIDPNKAREALSKYDEIANFNPDEKAKEQIEAIKSQLTSKFGKEKSEWENENKFLLSQVEKLLIDAKASALLNTKSLKGNATLLLPHIRNRTKVVRGENGDFITQVIDENGNVQISPKSNSTAPMTIDELLETMKGQQEFAPAFEGTEAIGSGAAGSFKSGGHGLRKMSKEEASDPRAYQRMKDACEKAGANILDFLPE